MKAVFRHELKSCFTSLTGYIFCAFYLLFAGIYTMVYNLKNNIANFEYIPGSMSFIFMIMIPVLTMRVFAEERHRKTDQLFYSLPLPLSAVVLGKYFALLAVMLLPTLIMSFYPVLLSSYGKINFLSAFSAIAGFFLLGAALTAIGLFISSLTESQAVAAFLCFVVMLINYFLASLADFVSDSAFSSYAALTVLVFLTALIFRIMTGNLFAAVSAGLLAEVTLTVVYMLNTSSFEGFFPSTMNRLSLFERFYGFVDGIFDLTGVFYFAGVVVFFLYLTVQTLEKRRWSD